MSPTRIRTEKRSPGDQLPGRRKVDRRHTMDAVSGRQISRPQRQLPRGRGPECMRRTMQFRTSAGQYTNLPGALFEHLSSEATEGSLSRWLRPSSYRAGAVLFSEKDPAPGIYIVLEGEVKLSMNSSDGRRLILRIARKGEILGLASALSGKPCEMTAETLYPAKIAPIQRAAIFSTSSSRHPEVYQTVTEELSRDYTMACEQLRTVGFRTPRPRNSPACCSSGARTARPPRAARTSASRSRTARSANSSAPRAKPSPAR